MFNETWRACREEFEELARGHVWFGSGRDARNHGVGMLLHKRGAGHVHRWSAICARLGMLELNAGPTKISLIVAYLPHCGYKDEEVQAVYDELSKQLYFARARKRVAVIGGDWNAEAQSDPDNIFPRVEWAGMHTLLEIAGVSGLLDGHVWKESAFVILCLRKGGAGCGPTASRAGNVKSITSAWMLNTGMLS